MSKLLQAQTDMLSAQAQAVAVQGLPSMAKFSGENMDPEEDGFERWLETFEERARLAGWSPQHKFYQTGSASSRRQAPRNSAYKLKVFSLSHTVYI